MTAVDATLALVTALAIINYWLWQSVLYPPFIFCFMWVFDLATWRMNLIDVYPLHRDTLVIVAAAAVVFTAGGALATLVPRRLLSLRFFPEDPRQRNGLLHNILTAISLCGLPLFAYQVLQISRQGVGANILMRARAVEVQAAQNGQQIHSVVFDYFVLFATLLALLFATEEERGWRFWTVTLVAFAGCILSTGRTNLLLLIAGLCAIKLLRENRERFFQAIKALRWPVALFIALYIILIFTNKNTSGFGAGTGGIVSYFVVSYIVGPLAAFDAVVQSPSSFALASTHVFEFPAKIAAAFHLISYTAPPKLDTFVQVPFPANVYTVFKFYFLELGVSGTLVIMFVIGFLQSLLFIKAKQGSRLAWYFFGYSVYAVIMVIFDDAYYDAGNYLRAFVFGAIYFALSSWSFHVIPRARFHLLERAHPEGASNETV